MAFFKITSTKTAGINRNKATVLESGFESIAEAGNWLINDSMEILPDYMGVNEALTAIIDHSSEDEVFKVGDISFQAGDYLITIEEEAMKGLVEKNTKHTP